MMKKIASLTVAGALALSFLLCAGCDSLPGSGSLPSPDPSPSGSVEPSNSPTPSVAPSSVPSVSGGDRDYLSDAEYEEGGDTGYEGEVLATYWFNFCVEECYFADSYGGYSPADDGMQLLVVELAIKSTSRNEQPMFDTDFEIAWDDDEAEYDYTYPLTIDEGHGFRQPHIDSMLSDDQLPNEYPLEAGAVVAGHLIYEVPINTTAGDPIDFFYFSFLESFNNGEDGDIYVIGLYPGD